MTIRKAGAVPQRRKLIARLTAAGPAVRGLVALLALALAIGGCGGSGSAAGGSGGSGRSKGAITFWWWGQEEAPGLQGWLQQTAALFQQKTGIKVNLVEQTTNGLPQAEQASEAAGKGPDLQWFWPVGFFQSAMFTGGLTPLNHLLGTSETSHYSPASVKYATWQGKLYGAPMYSIGNAWVYNKVLFRKAGLTGPPRTFAELLADGRKLRAAGITPIAAGMKDQAYADWPWMLLQPCGLNSVSQWFDGFLGRTPGGLTAPQFSQTWTKIAATVAAGMYPSNVNDLALYDGFNLFRQGKAAIATPVAPTDVTWARQMGSNTVGVFLSPCQNEGALASKYPDATHFVGIPSFSQHKAQAAEFIRFMHSRARESALYVAAGALMGDDRVQLPANDPAGPVARQLLTWSQHNAYFSVDYTSPPNLDNWVWPLVGDLINNKITPTKAAQTSETQQAAWRKTNPTLVKDYAAWESQVTGTGG